MRKFLLLICLVSILLASTALKAEVPAVSENLQLITASPDSEQAVSAVNAGKEIYMQSGDPAGAVDWLQQVIGICPGSEAELVAQFALAEVYRSQGALGQPLARSAYYAVIQLRPESPAALQAAEAISKLYADSKQYKIAIRELKGIIANYPLGELSLRCQYLLGKAYQASKDTSMAQATFDKLIATYPTHPQAAEAVSALAELYRAQNEPALALAAISQLIASYPDSEISLRAQGEIIRTYLYQGRLEQAEAMSKQLWQTYSSHGFIAAVCKEAAEVRFELGWQSLLKHDYQTAIDYLNRTMDTEVLKEGWWVELRMIAQCYEALERYDEAAATYQRLVEMFPKLWVAPLAQYQVGLVLSKQGRYQEAVVELQRVIDRWPASDMAIPARQMIESINRSLGLAHN